MPGGVKADTYYNMLLAVNGTDGDAGGGQQERVHAHLRAARRRRLRLRPEQGHGRRRLRQLARRVRQRRACRSCRRRSPSQSTEDFQRRRRRPLHRRDHGRLAGGRRARTRAAPAAGATELSLLDLGAGRPRRRVVPRAERAASTPPGARASSSTATTTDASSSPRSTPPADQVIIGHYAEEGRLGDRRGGLAADRRRRGLHARRDAQGHHGERDARTARSLLGHVFNAATVDGAFGLLARGGAATFDDVAREDRRPGVHRDRRAATCAPRPSAAARATPPWRKATSTRSPRRRCANGPRRWAAATRASRRSAAC